MKRHVKITMDEPGQGASATRGKKVTIRYDGFLHRGSTFQGNILMSFVLGEREVIAGLEYGVEGMQVGGKRRFEVPPHLGFREVGVPGVIPPNALLIFHVELLDVSDKC